MIADAFANVQILLLSIIITIIIGSSIKIILAQI